MCTLCNYPELLNRSNIETTSNRLRVLEIIGGNPTPLSAAEVIAILQREADVNRVTIYRILDLLVGHGLLERLSTGGRAFCYGMAPNSNHPPHPHFYCKKCGQMECLDAGSLAVDATWLQKIFSGRIDKIEIRADGVCKNCLRPESSRE